ncbi:MAG: EAL domain-containing protein [Methylococcaceae bacterium]|nr:EAL domain-containing protein [Methylococcaceae bacterium]
MPINTDKDNTAASSNKSDASVAPVKPLMNQENALMEDKPSVLNREESVSFREEAILLREHAADIREKTVNDREDSVDDRDENSSTVRDGVANIREDTADAREDAADKREESIFMRESHADLREKEILAEETLKAASNHLIIMLQQANAHLVTVSIEAQKMAEQVKVAKEQLAYLAHHDVLTDLPNRILLLDRLNSAIELAGRKGWQLALMFMDLDRFKHINDSLGHIVGDKLLQSVAKRLLGCARHSDTISRQGGDEFVVLLPVIEHTEDAAQCAQKLIAALKLPHHINGHDIHVNVSIGISIYPDDGQDAETLMKNADTAMFCAKENKRNKFKFFEPDMNARAVQRHSIEASLHFALERQEFVLYYQPKIDLSSGMIVGVEALIRWQHPERGLMPPKQFIAIAEDCGLILPIGRWVLREACIQAQAWHQAGLPRITISVNTSALEFHDIDFIKNLRVILKETGLEPCCLELELTENVLMQDAEFAEPVLNSLSELGIKLAIDDFGIGYSSLSYLKQFPINTLKIDQSFVHKMMGNPNDASIVSAVINLGKTLKLRVIAEGVETSEQQAFLVAQHCDEAQGYYLGRPMEAESFATLLQSGISNS